MGDDPNLYLKVPKMTIVWAGQDIECVGVDWAGPAPDDSYQVQIIHGKAAGQMLTIKPK